MGWENTGWMDTVEYRRVGLRRVETRLNAVKFDFNIFNAGPNTDPPPDLPGLDLTYVSALHQNKNLLHLPKGRREKGKE